jgi:hypothetical protein
VSRGHYRTDTLGQNLNRFYHEPHPLSHPTIFAIKKYMLQRAKEGQLHMFIDLHAHATKRGVFVFGNNLSTTEQLVETVMYAKLISLNSAHFEFSACNFTEKNMRRKDRRDGLSKSGSGRVAMYRETGLTHIYTLECNYNTGLSTNAIKAASGPGAVRSTSQLRPPAPTLPSAQLLCGVGGGVLRSDASPNDHVTTTRRYASRPAHLRPVMGRSSRGATPWLTLVCTALVSRPVALR